MGGGAGDHDHHHPDHPEDDHHEAALFKGEGEEEEATLSLDAITSGAVRVEDSAASIATSITASVASDSLKDNNNNIPEESKAQARSERKRSREKQRRSDVNKQFNDLTKVLRQIEVEEAEDDCSSKPRLAFSATNRVDLIARTIVHLERLSHLSKKRKTEMESLQQQLDLAKKAGEETAQKLKEAMFSQPVGKQQVRAMCNIQKLCEHCSPLLDI